MPYEDRPMGLCSTLSAMALLIRIEDNPAHHVVTANVWQHDATKGYAQTQTKAEDA